jgi:predicted ATPase
MKTPPPVPASEGNGRCRIVLTGGPGGGKTTAADLFRREIGDRVVIVPEAATMIFGGGFPRSREAHAAQATQRAIYHVQRNLEDVQSALYPNRILLCDRGSVDGAAYWPDEPHHFFDAVGSSLERELARYDAVIFFETAAAGNLSFEGGNPVRNESSEEALKLDRRLRALWSQHQRFVFVPHNPSFFKKISFGLAVLDGMVNELRCKPKPRRAVRVRRAGKS